MATAKTARKKTAAKKTVAKKAVSKTAKARKTKAPLEIEEPYEPGSTSLVIVESPAKAKTIGKYLGRGYRVKATIGHVRDLPEKKMGIDIENGFEPEYVTIPGKEKTLAELKNFAKDSREMLPECHANRINGRSSYESVTRGQLSGNWRTPIGLGIHLSK